MTSVRLAIPANLSSIATAGYGACRSCTWSNAAITRSISGVVEVIFGVDRGEPRRDGQPVSIAHATSMGDCERSTTSRLACAPPVSTKLLYRGVVDAAEATARPVAACLVGNGRRAAKVGSTCP